MVKIEIEDEDGRGATVTFKGGDLKIDGGDLPEIDRRVVRVALTVPIKTREPGPDGLLDGGGAVKMDPTSGDTAFVGALMQLYARSGVRPLWKTAKGLRKATAAP